MIKKISSILLLLFSFIILIGTATAAELCTGGECTDMNVTVPDPDVNAGFYISPSALNFRIEWWFKDGNFVAADHDLNLRIDLSTLTGDLNFVVIAVDTNADDYCIGDNPDYSSPVRCVFDWNTTDAFAGTDGNYVFDINMQIQLESDPAADTNSILTASASFVLDQNAPAVLTGVSATPIAGGTFELNWDQNTAASNPDDFNSYFYWYDTTEFTDCTSAANLDGVSTTRLDTQNIFTGLDTRTLYFFCVTVDDLAGNSNTTGASIATALSRQKGTGVPIPLGIPFVRAPTEIGPQVASVMGFLTGQVTQLGTFSVTGFMVVIGAVLFWQFFLRGKKKGKPKKKG